MRKVFLNGAAGRRSQAGGLLMNGFAKIFASMLRSTVWVGQPRHRKLVWVTLLCLADAEGNVWASVPGLARDAEVTDDEVEDALEHFRKPDKHSRTKDHDGRRIVDIDGGWHVLNHHKYREIQSTKQQADAKRSRKYRASRKAAAGGFEPVEAERRGVTGDVTGVTHHAASVTGRARAPERPTSLQPAETTSASVTRHAGHVRHAFPASASDQSLGDPSDPDLDQIPNHPAKDRPARASVSGGVTGVTGNGLPSGVFDAPVPQALPQQTFEVPDDWTGPKPRHVARCAEAGLDVELEADRFRTTHFQVGFPATPAGVDKRFDRWLIEAKVRAEVDRGKALANGGGAPRRGRMPTNGVAALQPDADRTGFEALDLPEPAPERPRRAARR